MFLISSFFLTTSYNSTFAFGKLALALGEVTRANFSDRPVSTAVLVCFITGVAFLILGRFLPATPRISSTGKRFGIPLAEQFELSSRSSLSSPSSPILGGPEEPAPSQYRYWGNLGLLVTACALRIETFRQVSLNTECAPAGYAVSSKRAVAVFTQISHYLSIYSTLFPS